MDKVGRYTILDYGKRYKDFIKGKCDDSQESEMMGMRTHFIDTGQLPLVTIIEKLIEYENFGGSQELLNFIKLTKNFIVAVEKEHWKLYKYAREWEKRNPLDEYRENNKKTIENLTMALLTKYTYDYLMSII